MGFYSLGLSKPSPMAASFSWTTTPLSPAAPANKGSINKQAHTLKNNKQANFAKKTNKQAKALLSKKRKVTSVSVAPRS